MNEIVVTSNIDPESVVELNTVAERMNAMADMASAIVVEGDDTLIEAMAAVESLEGAVKVVESIIEPFRARAYQHYQDTLADKKAFTARANEAVASLRLKVALYRDKVTAALREAQRAAVEEGDSKDLVKAEKEAALTDNVGVSYREHWKADCVDIVLLCKAVVEGKAPQAIVQYNEKEGNRLARSLKELTGNIPGLKARKETRVVRDRQ